MKQYKENVAYDFELFAPRPAEVTPIPVAYKEPKKKNKTASKPVAKKGAKPSPARKTFSKVMITAVALFLICFNIYTRVEIADVNTKIISADKELEKLNNEKLRLEMELENKISLGNLEQAAKELGMQKKERSQIKYIDTSGGDLAEIIEAKR